jgi:hypothetical protein
MLSGFAMVRQGPPGDMGSRGRAGHREQAAAIRLLSDRSGEASAGVPVLIVL